MEQQDLESGNTKSSRSPTQSFDEASGADGGAEFEDELRSLLHQYKATGSINGSSAAALAVMEKMPTPTATEVTTIFHLAAKQPGGWPVVKFFYKAYKDCAYRYLLQPDPNRDTPLHLMARHQDAEPMIYLAKLHTSKLFKDLCRVRSSGKLPVHELAMNTNKTKTPAFAWLVSHFFVNSGSADDELARWRTTAGDTIVHLAARFQTLEAVEGNVEIFKHTSKLRGCDGRYPIHDAVLNKRSDVAKYLIDMWPKEVLRYLDNYGLTPVHYCIQHQLPDVSDAIIRRITVEDYHEILRTGHEDFRHLAN